MPNKDMKRCLSLCPQAKHKSGRYHGWKTKQESLTITRSGQDMGKCAHKEGAAGRNVKWYLCSGSSALNLQKNWYQISQQCYSECYDAQLKATQPSIKQELKKIKITQHAKLIECYSSIKEMGYWWTKKRVGREKRPKKYATGMKYQLATWCDSISRNAKSWQTHRADQRLVSTREWERGKHEILNLWAWGFFRGIIMKYLWNVVETSQLSKPMEKKSPNST